jgi:5-methylcytosine-specific restriction enzyme A
MPLMRKPMKRTYRSTGPSQEVVTAVLERAGYSCEACGKPVGDRRGEDWSVQHRLPRRMGGTRWAGCNLPSNLMILCGSATTPGSCHLFAESHRASAVAAGWLVLSRSDPTTVAVLVDRGSRWVYLGNDAQYHEAPPADRGDVA